MVYRVKRRGTAGVVDPGSTPGIKGQKGSKGQMGDDGLPGMNGLPGDDGSPGSKGQKGDPGIKGEPGSGTINPGSGGEKGQKGEPGAAGAAGAMGSKGDDGSQGLKGQKGEPGSGGGVPENPNQSHVWFSANGATPSGIPDGAESGDIAVNQQVTLPVFAVNSYLFISQPSADSDLIGITIAGIQVFGGFTKGASTFVDSGVTYEYWRSNRLLLASQYSGESIVLHR